LFSTGQQRGPGQIQPGAQQLCPGDRILLMPGPGLEIVGVEDGHYFVACTPDAAMSWCLDAEPLGQHSCRLISRWRTQWLPSPPTGSGTPNGCIASVTFMSASARHGAARSMSVPRRSSLVV
jgi:hypothetical protein